MSLIVATDIDQPLSGDLVYDLVHPETGHLMRIGLMSDEEGLAVELAEYQADQREAHMISHSCISHRTPDKGRQLAQGFARMYVSQGYVLQTEPPEIRRGEIVLSPVPEELVLSEDAVDALAYGLADACAGQTTEGTSPGVMLKALSNYVEAYLGDELEIVVRRKHA